MNSWTRYPADAQSLHLLLEHHRHDRATHNLRYTKCIPFILLKSKQRHQNLVRPLPHKNHNPSTRVILISHYSTHQRTSHQQSWSSNDVLHNKVAKHQPTKCMCYYNKVESPPHHATFTPGYPIEYATTSTPAWHAHDYPRAQDTKAS